MGGSGVQGHRQLRGTSEVSLGYTRLCLKRKAKRKIKENKGGGEKKEKEVQVTWNPKK